ncbi:hypothetical protein OEZ86_002089 [Tetradesmus obliquus]|nr:hypothetical protein OEZ86_002089 [Tetradesmus obliquus]
MDAVDEVGGYVVPRQRFVLRPAKRYSEGDWYTQRQYAKPTALHAAILSRCGQGTLESAALQYLLSSAATARDAQLGLSALGAVRSVAVARGDMAPWGDPFVKTFVMMAVRCDAHEVLLSAMQRPNELGLVFKWKSLLAAVKRWGDQGRAGVDKLEAIVFAMEGAGLRPNEKMVYVLVRAYVNAGEFARVDAALAWFRERGVVRYKPAMLPLLAKAAAAGSAGAAAVLAAAAAVQQGGDGGSGGGGGSESDEEGQEGETQ